MPASMWSRIPACWPIRLRPKCRAPITTARRSRRSCSRGDNHLLDPLFADMKAARHDSGCDALRLRRHVESAERAAAALLLAGAGGKDCGRSASRRRADFRGNRCAGRLERSLSLALSGTFAARASRRLLAHGSARGFLRVGAMTMGKAGEMGTLEGWQTRRYRLRCEGSARGYRQSQERCHDGEARTSLSAPRLPPDHQRRSPGRILNGERR